MAGIGARSRRWCPLLLRHCQRELLDRLALPVALAALEPKVVAPNIREGIGRWAPIRQIASSTRSLSASPPARR
jgi:hypothetical protein